MQDRGSVAALFLRVSDDRRDAMMNTLGVYFKRAGDITAAFIIIFLVSPILIAIILALAMSSPGLIFYRHGRVGRNGRRFQCVKFRTMHSDGADRLALLLASNRAAAAQWSRARKLDDDPRISAVGRVLRRTSLDELPQLFNVLLGDMSLVGPRPITADELSRYGTSIRGYLSVLPGITGLWQVSGRNKLSYGERVRLDASYARNWSLRGDLLILMRTPIVVILQRGAQ